MKEVNPKNLEGADRETRNYRAAEESEHNMKESDEKVWEVSPDSWGEGPVSMVSLTQANLKWASSCREKAHPGSQCSPLPEPMVTENCPNTVGFILKMTPSAWQGRAGEVQGSTRKI